MPRTSKKKPQTKRKKLAAVVKKSLFSVRTQIKTFLKSRPHRSFRLSKRRDYNRSLKLPGYVAFGRQVTNTLWRYKKIFVSLGVVYAALTIVLIGIGSQQTYLTLASTLRDTGSQIFQGNIGLLGQAALIFISISSSGLTGTPTEAQQIYVVILGLLVWLTTVWLLRHLLAGHTVKMRDGLYNAGAPIISTVLIVLVMVVQLIPVGLAVVGFAAANSSGLLAGGVAAMLFWFGAALLVVMSLYLLTSSFFALVIVTLPGMYPLRALKTAGDMMVGRRLRILLRIAWMMIAIIVAGAVVLVPIIMINIGLTNLWPAIGNVPVVPVVLMLFSVVAFIWSASYIYLLYRKIVDDDAKPAL
ncbi:MAG: hypothetical protein EOT05_04165 [Candidatus Microsaccharimonas sossegonensis]|uniref:Glycerophosphoryl diester phosphodiesterase membrane domain-containing protein n=1 Tax=Candidatus Microsaccharimonas sossegonensis TaxID=2506948 RepID=A0A4Q0AIM6_9BACT|nr:MAG: hypothetical protein EOT05_04165 [Candidatus Microsaccharimonas sossegonensis]